MKVNSRCQEAIVVTSNIFAIAEIVIFWLKNPQVPQFHITGSINSLNRNSLCTGDMGITENFSGCGGVKLEILITVFKYQYFPLQAADIEWGLHRVQEFWTKLFLVQTSPGHFWEIKPSVTTTTTLTFYFNNDSHWTVYIQYHILHRIYWLILFLFYLFF